ncbi:MAG: MFS transporter [Beijerinckiaceae bacterium]
MTELPSHAPDSRYAWTRLALTLLAGSVACAGQWTAVVSLPIVQAEFSSLRADASLAFTLLMCGFAFGTLVMGKITDRFGIMVPVLLSAVLMAAGFGLAGLSRTMMQYTLAHVLVGIAASAGFAPLMADVSHWFRKYRALAVVIAASGSYLSGVISSPLFQKGTEIYGWRTTHIAFGLIGFALLVPIAFALRRRPDEAHMQAADHATVTARADLGLSPGVLQGLLVLAGFACCVAMAMPQVHIVAYCADLGYGVAVGAQMLALMLGLGVVSRIFSGFVADRLGGAVTLLVGSAMQGVALALYLFFNGLTSLAVITGIFGLFQGGIVPMYAVLVREFLPAREAGARIGLVVTATIFGMAFGGYISGVIFDYTASYRMAFLNGLIWNAINFLIVGWIFLKQKGRPQVRAA